MHLQAVVNLYVDSVVKLRNVLAEVYRVVCAGVQVIQAV